jgi:hypothetical protein
MGGQSQLDISTPPPTHTPEIASSLALLAMTVFNAPKGRGPCNDRGKGRPEVLPSGGGLGLSLSYILIPPLLEERGIGGEVKGDSYTFCQ